MACRSSAPSSLEWGGQHYHTKLTGLSLPVANVWVLCQKQAKRTHQVSRRKKIIKTREEMKDKFLKIEKKINKSKSWFFQTVHKIDKPLAHQEEKTQVKKIRNEVTWICLPFGCWGRGSRSSGSPLHLQWTHLPLWLIWVKWALSVEVHFAWPSSFLLKPQRIHLVFTDTRGWEWGGQRHTRISVPGITEFWS